MTSTLETNARDEGKSEKKSAATETRMWGKDGGEAEVDQTKHGTEKKNHTTQLSPNLVSFLAWANVGDKWERYSQHIWRPPGYEWLLQTPNGPEQVLGRQRAAEVGC